MEHPIGTLPRTPFPASRDFPSRGNEKIGGTGYCVTYDTDSQSRNVLASPLGEEGHEVAKGWTVVRMIMTLDMDVTAERRHYNTYRPKGNPQPSAAEPLSPPERKRTQPFYTTCGASRAPFLKIAAKPPPQPSARRAVKLKNLPAVRPVHLKNPHAAGVSKSYCFFPPAMLELAGTKSAENAIGNFCVRKFL